MYLDKAVLAQGGGVRLPRMLQSGQPNFRTKRILPLRIFNGHGKWTLRVGAYF